MPQAQDRLEGWVWLAQASGLPQSIPQPPSASVSTWPSRGRTGDPNSIRKHRPRLLHGLIREDNHSHRGSGLEAVQEQLPACGSPELRHANPQHFSSWARNLCMPPASPAAPPPPALIPSSMTVGFPNFSPACPMHPTHPGNPPLLGEWPSTTNLGPPALTVLSLMGGTHSH